MRLTKYDKPMTAALSQPEPLPGSRSRPSILNNADYVADLKEKTRGKSGRQVGRSPQHGLAAPLDSTQAG